MKGLTIPERMLEILEDGEPHPVSELHALCGPSSRSVVSFHIVRIRRHLLKPDEMVLCVIHNSSIHYQLVRRFG